MYPYGLIGNCQTAALVSQRGSIDWLCWPRPDSPPIFGRLLDSEGGHFSIEASGNFTTTQNYDLNTTVLETIVSCEDGSSFKITDFCPRFYQYGRIFRPSSIFRKVEPIQGNPSIRVFCKPVYGWDKKPLQPIHGNSHLRFEIEKDFFRLTTNMPLTYLREETSFNLKDSLYFGLTWNSAIEEDLIQLTQRFLAQTTDYWKTWVKHCSIPSLYQKETIRSALTLKLHCYEDTGAILAALTTSLPEENGQGRNWDYRFCWLRDAYFVLSAFHNLGHFEEMEGFIQFLLNVAENSDHSDRHERLRPVYRLDQSLPLPEIEHTNWSGYQSSQPVRSGNQAAEHVQHDVYGEMILTFSPIFFDERFNHLRTPSHERLLKHLAELCAKNISKPDAGLWELRNGWQEHTFSNLMCWAGLDRLSRIQEKGYLKNIDLDLPKLKGLAHQAVCSAVKDHSLRNGPRDDSFDAALLQLPILRFPDERLSLRTVERIWSELTLNSTSSSQNKSAFLYRYKRKDDFGLPQSAFLICSFWLAQALAKVGKLADAQTVMKETMSAANSLGLFSEHYLPLIPQQAGNFPQAYSHVGQINSAFAVSPLWNDVL